MTYLFLCQIGPVQSFIAAGRRTQDLAAGSIMLSELAKSGLNAIQHNSSFKPIFPMWDTQEKFPQGVPHRFAFLCDGNPQAIAKKIENTICGRWVNEYAKEVFDILSEKSDTNDWKRIFETQMDDWLEFYWVAVPYSDHNTSFDAVNHAMVQRRLLRNFSHIEAEGVKCSLTGAQSALPLNWSTLKDLTGKDENERLGTTAIIKRL